RAAWAINKNYENQRGAVCTAGDVPAKIVSSPEVSDASKCLAMKDDGGNAGAPHASGGGSSGSDGDNREAEDQSPAMSVRVSVPIAVAAAVVAALCAY
ncbi:hypothetical protein IWQ57_004231, partial [Coemansia nantahalensis]